MSFRTKAISYFSYLMEDRPHSLVDKTVLELLKLLSLLYGAGVEHTYASYRKHPEKQLRAKAIVISLGNITVGGTGKTPTACTIARRLQKLGYNIAVLNRGYRAKKENETAIMSDGKELFLTAGDGGDEACLLARSLPGVPVVIGCNRAASAKLAASQFDAQVLLLDDGFQHWALARDLDIVLIDGTNPFGNGYMLPRGILREPLEHLDRAGLFIITKADLVSRRDIERINATLRQYNQKAPIAEAVHRAKWCIPFAYWNSMKCCNRAENSLAKGSKCLALSALGNPASFEQTIQSFGYELAGKLRFDDHHSYTEADVMEAGAAAEAAQAVIVTTEKDAVKLPADYILEHHIPVYVLGIEIEIIKGNETVNAVLRRVLGG